VHLQTHLVGILIEHPAGFEIATENGITGVHAEPALLLAAWNEAL